MKLRIGRLLFEIIGLDTAFIPENTMRFATDEVSEADRTYTFHFVASLPHPDEHWHQVYGRQNISVFQHASLEYRILSVSSPQDAYAVYEETDESHANVYFQLQQAQELTVDTVFISCLALERQFARHDCYVLHCAHLCYKNHSILFSGPSGIGKSTHADIWCRTIDDTHVVNGDRCLIVRKDDGGFEAYGWPVCGSSGICRAEHYPLEAIVFIEQTRMNQVIAEKPTQHFKRIAAQLTINHWNTSATNLALDFISALCDKVETITYGCNMNPDAAMTLKEHIGKITQKGG